jgi:hypothetical protein
MEGSGSLVINSITRKSKRHSLLHFLLFVLIVFSLIFASTPEVRAAEVRLAWDPNPEPAVQGYRVYFGKASGFYTNVVDVGNRTDYVVPGLDTGATYFFAATAYDATGDESNFSNEISYAVPAGAESSSSSSSGGGGGCFIATAAYGSWLAPEVATLQEFRDRYLLTNQTGQSFVEWYYRVSPPAAAFIAEHESLKTAVRWGLAPVVYAVKYPAALAVILLIPIAVIVRKRGRRSARVKRVSE